MSYRLLIAGLTAVLAGACGGAKTDASNAGDSALSSDGTVSDGERLVERGDYAGAAALFEGIVAKSPDDPKAHYYLALSKSKLGDMDGAVTHYEKAIALDDKLMDAHINLGLLLMDRGDLSRAEAELKIYLDASPDAADAQFNYGLVQETMGRLEQAKTHYEAAAKLDPEDPSPLFGLGDLARKQGDKKAAVALYEKARALDSEMAELVYVEGLTLLEMNESDRACALFESLLSMSKPDLVIVSEAGKAIAKADKACATKLYRGALEQDEQFAAAHFYLANLLARDKQFEAAADHFEKFIEVAPDDPAVDDAKKRLAACRSKIK